MGQPLLIIILPYPQNKTPIGRKGVEKGRTVDSTWRDHNNISRYNVIGPFLDGNRNLSLKEKIKFVKTVAVGRNTLIGKVFIIIDFKSVIKHILAI